MKRNKGFTLMELLVAVSIFAVIAVSLYSIFSGGIQIWKRQEKGFVYNHTVRLVFDTMARELRNAINYSQAPQAATAETQAEMKLLKFTGEEKKLTFITLGGTEIEKVDYIFEETAQDKGQLRKKTVFQKD
ncbi:MAG: type II secretion system protein, partial [Candidatus Omnitrophica bacterium]|nr:type II secretion system protein [Candidatus Omnitrophota bacterium]